MNKSKLMVAALVTAASCASCSDEVPAIPDSELYTREWVKEFGAINPNQDWNAATAGVVNVTTDAPATVKVNAMIQGTNYLLAKYDDVSGSRSLRFDIPKGVKELTVSCGNERVKTTLGGSVSFAGAGRAIWDNNQDPHETVKVSRTTDFRELSDVAVRSFGATLKEGQNNLNIVTQNFEFVANGPFTIYPVFWKTDAYNTLGIYYIRKDQSTGKEYMVHVPFYTNKIAPIDSTKGNLLYLPGKFSQKGVEARWIDASSTPSRYVIYSYHAEKYNEHGKTDFNDFDDEDWAYFKSKMSDPANFAWAFDITYMSTLAEGIKSQIRVDDMKYQTFQENGSTNVRIESIHLTGADGYLNKDEENWVYPGSSDANTKALQDSYPNYEAYLGYLKQDLTDDEIAAKGFEFPALWRSRGIKIDIPEGTRFGMYIRTQLWDNTVTGGGVPNKDNIEAAIELEIGPDGKPLNAKYDRFYSNSAYNKKDMVLSDWTTVQAVHAATYLYTAPSGIPYRVLGFEDWSGSQSDRDLNDMIFFIGSADPTDIPDVDDIDKPEETPMKWLIACEDLGNKDDFDFNDVVFQVEHVSGQPKATITPLAAGGTLETYLWRADDATFIGDEWHKNFGDGSSSYTTMINTYKGQPLQPGKKIEIDVPTNFSISPDATNYKESMGGFYLEVRSSDGTVKEITPPVLNENGVSVAPQMILIFEPEGKPWRWPKERTGIHVAYPSFLDWVARGVFDATEESGVWSLTPAKDDHVVDRK